MIKHLILGAVCLWTASGLLAQASGTLSQPLLDRIATDQASLVDVSVLLRSQADFSALNDRWSRQRPSPEARSRAVIELLQQTAAATQPTLLNWMAQEPGIDPASVRTFWVANVVFVQATPEAIYRIASHPLVASVDLNHPVLQEATACEAMIPDGLEVQNGKEPGLELIGAPELWRMGYTGYGRVAMSLDTGVDPDHPALKQRYRGNFVPKSWAWFEYNSNNVDPFDCDGHGSHTVGTMVGLDRDRNDTIGVAFNGLWIGSPGLCGGGGTLTDKTIGTFEWALNPDGDPATASDMPDAINNSWFNSGLTDECQSLYVQTLTSLETAGIAVIFSAGNSGPGISTITPPKNINTDLVNSFAVGAVAATAANTPVANFSSRGPSICLSDSSSLLIKPEVAAPGVSVRSSLPGNVYGNLSGTSMAAPHAAGAVVLLKEAFPYLTGTEIKLALYFSAIDLGAPGEDNDYGMGLINLPAAFQYLVNAGNVPVVPRNERNVAIQEVLNLGEKVCTPNPMPVVILKNEGEQVVTSATVVFTYTPGGNDTLHWTGIIPVGGVSPAVAIGPVLGSGDYTFVAEVIDVNGQADDRPLDNRFSADFSIFTGPRATGLDAEVCVGARTLLKANVPYGTVRWFTTPTGGQPIGEGTTLLSPAISADTAFYAEGFESFRIGLADTVGYAVANGTAGDFIRFTVHQSGILQSVKTHISAPGVLFITLRDSAGNILGSKPQFLFAGTSVVELGFDLIQDQTYTLEASGMPFLLGIPSGVTYPMVIQGGATVIAANTADAYPGFFDLKFAANPSCDRDRVPVKVLAGSLTPSIAVSDTLVNNPAGERVQFADFTSGVVSRLWNFGDGTTDTAQTIIHTYLMEGTYLATLEVNSGTGCVAAASQKITVYGERPSALDYLSQARVSLSPNPNDGTFIALFPDMPHREVNLSLTDLTGRVVWQTLALTGPNADFRISVGKLPAGVYSFRWSGGGKTGAELVQIR